MPLNHTYPNSFRLFEDHAVAASNNLLLAAPAVSKRSIVITDLIISNGGTAGTIFLVEDPAGTPVQITQTFYLPINGGAVINFAVPIKLTAEKALGFTSATVTTHSIQVNGYYEP